MPRSCVGLGFDSSENSTIFIGFVPGTNELWDLPPLDKCPLIAAPKVLDADKVANKGAAIDALVQEAVNRKMVGRAKTKRGLKSLECLQMLDQQLDLLFKSSLHHLGATQPWYKGAGDPHVPASVAPSHNGGAPNMITLVTDQGSDICMAVQAMQWAGCRLMWLMDHNHRDDNDAKTVGASLNLSIEVLGKCAIGPYGMGLWHKAIVESATLLEEDHNSVAQ